MKDDKNVYEAKTSIKNHIKFMEALLKHLNGSNPIQKGRAMWAAWCLHRYINDRLMDDITESMIANMTDNKEAANDEKT